MDVMGGTAVSMVVGGITSDAAGGSFMDGALSAMAVHLWNDLSVQAYFNGDVEGHNNNIKRVEQQQEVARQNQKQTKADLKKGTVTTLKGVDTTTAFAVPACAYTGNAPCVFWGSVAGASSKALLYYLEDTSSKRMMKGLILDTTLDAAAGNDIRFQIGNELLFKPAGAKAFDYIEENKKVVK